MEWTTLFTDVLKLSPFVAALLFFLMTVWRKFEKKDDAMMTMMKDHQSTMIDMHEKSIQAQNNSADATRQQADSVRQQAESVQKLAGVVDGLKDHISEKVQPHRPARNGVPRKLPITSSAAA